MKRLQLQLFMICLLLSALSFGQNQSDGNVDPIISTPIGQQFGGQEIFRFQPGVITQLNSGNGFGFSNDRWFSIGELTTQPSGQTVFGLRFQLPNRGVSFGYQDFTDDSNNTPSPRVQWFDDTDNPSNLEFRFADDFNSINSDLVAVMTSEGQFNLPGLSGLIPFPPFFPSSNRFFMLNDTFDNGIYARTINSNVDGVGVWGDSRGNTNNVGVRGIVDNSATGTNFAYAIEGIATPNGNQFTNTSYAGFFNGQVVITGNGSDRKLKKDIKPINDALSNITQLKSYSFKYKDHKDLNLPLELRHGFIAQEIEKVYPELVKVITYPIYNDKRELQGTGTYKSVNYTGLISELAAAIKELNQKVKDLKNTKTTLVYSSQFTEEELAKIKANGYQLEQNVPNPFSGATSITYSLPENAPQASIMIFDLSGKLLKTYKLKERAGQLLVNQSDLGKAGMYLYSLFAGGQEIMTKRMLVK